MNYLLGLIGLFTLLGSPLGLSSANRSTSDLRFPIHQMTPGELPHSWSLTGPSSSWSYALLDCHSFINFLTLHHLEDQYKSPYFTLDHRECSELEDYIHYSLESGEAVCLIIKEFPLRIELTREQETCK